jgi:hypothetical protein
MNKGIYKKENLQTCCGVPSKSFPHDRLNKVSPVNMAPEPAK